MLCKGPPCASVHLQLLTGHFALHPRAIALRPELWRLAPRSFSSERSGSLRYVRWFWEYSIFNHHINSCSLKFALATSCHRPFWPLRLSRRTKQERGIESH